MVTFNFLSFSRTLLGICLSQQVCLTPIVVYLFLSVSIKKNKLFTYFLIVNIAAVGNIPGSKNKQKVWFNTNLFSCQYQTLSTSKSQPIYLKELSCFSYEISTNWENNLGNFFWRFLNFTPFRFFLNTVVKSAKKKNAPHLCIRSNKRKLIFWVLKMRIPKLYIVEVPIKWTGPGMVSF